MKDHIPVIHNYYSDLLVSLAHYFDVVLGDDLIQHYEFNIGSKSFQLNYKTQKALPSCIINYNTSRMTQYHDWFLHRPDIDNNYLIPIVYDSTKDLNLLIQEAEYEHSIAVIFNCNSVFEMMELQHRFAPYLPLNKYIEVFNYYTFFEIPQYFLNPLMFDTNRDTIYNLYTKRDTLTNELVEMASVKYDPLIRLDSFEPGGIDTDNKTFSLNMELTILNTVPIYFQIPPNEIPRIKKKINEVAINNICLPLYEDIPIIKIDFFDNENNHQIVHLPLLNIDDNKNFKTIFNHNNNTYELTGQIISTYKYYSATIESNNYSYPISLEILNDNDIIIEGVLHGKLLNFEFQGNDTIIGKFSGNFNTTNLSVRTNILEDVTITLDIPTKIINYNIDNFQLYNLTTNTVGKIDDIVIIPYGEITLFHHHYHDRRLNLDFEKSIISKLGIYDTSSNSINLIDCLIDINKYGNIKYVTENKVNPKFTEYYSIEGCINSYTWKYSFVQNNEQERVNSHVLFVILDGIFNNEPKYGGTYIDNISLDIFTHSSIYQATPVYLSNNFKIFHDFNTVKFKNAELIYSVAIPNNSDYIIQDNDYAYINLIPYNQINHYKNLKDYKWTLFFRNKIYTFLNSDFVLNETVIAPFYYAITLGIPLKFYKLNFEKYNGFNDIFYFKLYSEENKLNANISK